MTAYDRLANRFARIATIGEASSVLSWDAATMMPPGGGAARGDQLAVLAGLSHSLLVGPGGRRRTGRGRSRTGNRSLARRQSAPDASRLYPRDGDAARSGGGAGARQFSLREGVARSPPQVRLRHGASPPGGGRAADPRGSRRIGARARSQPLRCADGRLPAWHARRRRRAGVRRLRALPAAGRCRRPKSARRATQPRSSRKVRSRSRSRRRCADACPNASGSISTTPGWIARRIRSPAARTTDVRITTRYDEADFTQAVLAVVHETGHALYERGLPAS